MSLLEDIFLGDEADEAQELERVIEGDEYDERPRSRSPSHSNSDENSEKEGEAEEDKTRVDPTKQKAKKVVKNPRFILNPARLTGPRGIQVIPEHFKDFKFKGKGHEKEDLDLVLKKLEHWAYRLYPKFQFEDCLKKIETLGKKQPVKVHLHRIRTDQLASHETVVQKDSSDDEQTPAPQEEDEFDKLLQQQIELARATPVPGSVKKGFMTPAEKTLAAPRATSSPSINDEQKERMLRNRQLAEERRLVRLKQNNSANVTIDLRESQQRQNSSAVSENEVIDITEPAMTKKPSEIIYETTTVDLTSAYYTETTSKITTNNEVEMINVEDIIVLNTEVVKPRRINKSNVIDSSDEECDITAVNQSVSVDIHNDLNVNRSCEKVGKNDKDVEITNRNVDRDVLEYEADLCTEDINSTNTKEVRSENIDGLSNKTTDITDVINQINNVNTENISSENTDDVCSVNFKNDRVNIDGISIANTDDIISQNIHNYENKVVNNAISDVNIEVNASNENVLAENKEKDLIEGITISIDNEKAKNKNLATNKENIDTNIVQVESIDEEVMDVDFSEEF